jgi:O-antigen/teichoic acid export membrane protein
VTGESASQPLPAHRVLRGATLLVLAQLICAPVLVLVNAIGARALGAVGFGLYYQAMTFASFVFLFVEWGQATTLPGGVATERGAIGELLGSGLALRLGGAAIACLAVPLVCVLVGYDREFAAVFALALLAGLFATVSGACLDALRGLERTDFVSWCYVGWQLLSAAVVVPTLLLGGGLRGMLIAQGACAACGAAFVLRMLPRLHVPRLSVRWSVAQRLLRDGRPFVIFSLVLLLQPTVDAVMLSWFAPSETMGWYAAARKLVGVLTYPASALVAALYPALCRVRLESTDAFKTTVSQSLYAVTVVAVPLALGCALFPDLGIALFGQRHYGPAETDLRLLAPFVFLVYFSMPIGSCLASSGRQTGWTVVQVGCVIVSIALDPPLIRWFQGHGGNGSLGVCLTSVISEILMVLGGAWLLPEGILQRLPRGKILAVALSGLLMAAVAISLSAWDVVPRAIVSVLAYLVGLGLLSGGSFGQLRSLLTVLRQR